MQSFIQADYNLIQSSLLSYKFRIGELYSLLSMFDLITPLKLTEHIIWPSWFVSKGKHPIALNIATYCLTITWFVISPNCDSESVI